MLSCLTDTIGLSGCGASSPVSGLLINSLPGISLKSVEYLADEEQKTYLGVWADVQKRAQARLSQMVHREFSKEFKLSVISQSIDLGKQIDTTNTTTASAQYRGVIFDLDPSYTDNNYKVSALQNHYIKQLLFYSPVAKTGAVIKVYDLDLNTILSTFTQDFVIGWNTIAVNTVYQERRIFVGVDSTTINSVSLSVTGEVNYCSDCGAWIEGGYFTIGANTSTITKGDNTFGLSVLYGVRCNYDKIICSNPDVFYETLWYLEGSELMQERISSDRINEYTVNKKEAKELKAFYDAEAETCIQQAVSGIALDEHDCCLECDEMYTTKETSNHFY